MDPSLQNETHWKYLFPNVNIQCKPVLWSYKKWTSHQALVILIYISDITVYLLAQINKIMRSVSSTYSEYKVVQLFTIIIVLDTDDMSMKWIVSTIFSSFLFFPSPRMVLIHTNITRSMAKKKANKIVILIFHLWTKSYPSHKEV